MTISGDEPAVMPWLFSKDFRRQHPDRVAEIKTRFTRGYLTMNSEPFQRQWNANVTHDTRDRLDRIQAPTQVLVGKDDQLTPPSMARELEREIPDAGLVVFERGGHGLYWEIPHEFNETVVRFLRQ